MSATWGRCCLRPKSGDVADAALGAGDGWFRSDIVRLAEGRQRYALFTNDAGGIIDDLMVANRGDHLFLVVNAACKAGDIVHMRAASVGCLRRRGNRRPGACWHCRDRRRRRRLAAIVPGVSAMKFMDVAVLGSEFGELWISRSGYTGEDGYEISVAEAEADGFARALLANNAVEPIGLGARDSLRLEAGLCLYGNDIDTTTSPVEAALEWAVQKARRNGGDRAAGFRGPDGYWPNSTMDCSRRRVGLLPEGRAPMRAGTILYAGADGGEPIGEVTSGAFGPSIGRPMSMGYVAIGLSDTGTTIYGEVRGKRMAAAVADMPFRPSTYKR